MSGDIWPGCGAGAELEDRGAKSAAVPDVVQAQDPHGNPYNSGVQILLRCWTA